MKIPRYNPNPLWWWIPFVNNKEGKFCEYRDYVKLEAENAKLRAAGDEMDLAISSVDPQRAERHRFMRLTDAEYLAVVKWRTAKDPNYIRG
jgi:hypothetical protein